MKVTKINTTTIVGNLRDEGQTSRADYLELMQKQLDEIEFLCNQVFETHQIEQGDFGIEYSNHNPAAAVASVIAWFEANIEHDKNYDPCYE